MKKFIISIILLFATMQAQAYEYNQYSSATAPTSSYSESTKIYDKNGSLQGYNKPQPNGTVKTYNKYNQVTGYYKKSGSKVKYYPKNKGQ